MSAGTAGTAEAQLKGKYPAKQHAKKVVEYIKSQGGDTSGVLYLEGQKTRMIEVGGLFCILHVFVVMGFGC